MKKLIERAKADRVVTEQQIERIEQQIERIKQQETIEKLHNALLRLDYEQQALLFKEFIEEKQGIGAFLVHGESEKFGQLWLLKRLLQQVTDIDTTPLIQFYLRRKSLRNDRSALWRQLGDEVGARLNFSSKEITDEEIRRVIERVIELLRTDHVILVLHDVEYYDQDYLNELIRDFWLPLASSVHKSTKQHNNRFLLMFLVDREGCVSTWNVTFARELSLTWEPHIPLSLPVIQCLSNEVLAHWIKNEIDSFPTKVTKQISYTVQAMLENTEGVPEYVFAHIFDLCDCDWHEWREKWLKL